MNSNGKRDFNTYVGTESGILKGIQFTDCGVFSKNFPISGELDRGNEITALLWRNEEENEIYVGHRNRTVSLFDTQTQEYVFRFSFTFGSGKIVSIAQCKGHVLVGTESGHIGALFKTEKEEKVRCDTLHNVKCIHKDKPNLAVVMSHPSEDNYFVTGGCENDVKIWDMQNLVRPIFRAKNVHNDELELRVPIWVSDMTFMQDNNTIAIVSRNKYVRLYDPRAKRAPILSANYEDSPLTSVCALPDRPRQVVLGTAHGRVALFDLRTKIRIRAPVVFKGINGAIKDVVAVSPQPPFAYSVSMDRYLRVHNLDTKETVHKEYLKSRLTKVLVRSTR